jgi:site-specific DNA-methyltransferase (adenine-specific)
MSSISLYQGDCIELLKQQPDHSVDAVICDLPYGTTQCKWDVALDFDALWAQYERVAKPKAPILLFSAQPFTSKLIMSRIDQYRYLWYWEKEKGTNFFRTGNQPLRVIEEICVFSRENGYTFNPQMIPLDKPYRHTMPLKHSAITGKGEISASQSAEAREYKVYTHAHPKNLVKFSRDNGNRSLVPTQKPVALLEYLVETYTNPGDIVLDNTMGSGTCGVACKRLGRAFVGMEMNEQHFQIASERIASEPVPKENHEMSVDDVMIWGAPSV